MGPVRNNPFLLIGCPYRTCRKKTVVLVFLSVCTLLLYAGLGSTRPDWSVYLFGKVYVCPLLDRRLRSNVKYIIDTPGCRIPNFEICPTSVSKYFTTFSLNCTREDRPDLTTSKGNRLYFFPERIHFYKRLLTTSWRYLKKMTDLLEATSSEVKRKPVLVKEFLKNISVICCYRGIVRIEQSRFKYDNDCDNKWRLKDKCTLITSYITTIPKSDAIVVECNATDNFYTNVHHLVQKRSSHHIIPREAHPRRKSIYRPKFSRYSESSKPLNVVIFATDSVSRYNFLRSNPNTYRYLVDELKAFDFIAYNKVGDNTYPNLVPVLSGLSEYELLSHKSFNNSEGATDPKLRKFDDCPFIWKDFKRRGYVTMYYEDASRLSTFNYLRTGFVNPPTDHYGRAPFMASDELIGRGELNVCQRNKLSIEVLQDYSVDFLNTYSTELTFSLLWTSALTHNDLNAALTADDPHIRYLKVLKQSGALERSILFFMSDHGLRYGSFRETLLGKFEESMPYLYIVVPDWFRKRFPEATQNLEKNSRTLTTPYDLHNTLLDILNMSYKNISHVKDKPSKATRSISLFQEIPTNRSCKDIGFPYKYCMCQEYTPMKNENSIYVDIEYYMKRYLNRMLQSYPNCSSVEEVRVVEVLLGKRDTKYFEGVQEDILSVQANYNPGNALIDAALIWTKSASSFQVIGDISRINKYGNQSRCINDNKLAKFCICTDTL